MSPRRLQTHEEHTITPMDIGDNNVQVYPTEYMKIKITEQKIYR